MQLQRVLNKRDGMSLIEILVALGIFVVGIITVFGIFPTGFGVLQHTAAASIADRLAQAELERIQSGGTPAGILSGTFQSDNSFLCADTDFEQINDSYSATSPAATYTDVNKFHYVFEETTLIPNPVSNANLISTSGEMDSFYYSKFSPMDINPTDGTVRVSVYSGPMNSVTLPGSLANLSLGPADYSVDYANDLLYVTCDNATPARLFYVSYTYAYQDSNGNNQLGSVVCQPINFALPAAGDLANQYQSASITLPSGATSLFSGSVTVRRGFVLLSTSQSWTPDNAGNPNPYEFKIVDSVRGLLAFNPAGYGYQELANLSGQGISSPTTLGTSGNGYQQPTNVGSQVSYQPLTAYVSYGVLDWHIIHEDKKVPTQTSALNGASDSALNVRLALGSIMKTGYSTNLDGTSYSGLSGSFTPLECDMIIADLDDGYTYTLKYTDGAAQITTTNPASTPTDGLPWYTLDYKNGIVHFDQYFYGNAVRIYYKASGEWAVSAYRAFSTFQRFIPNATTSVIALNYGQFYRGSNDSVNFGQEYGKLFFPQAYAGMTVALDYAYSVPLASGGSKTYTVYGEVHRISDSTLTPETTSGAFCYVDLATSLNSQYQSVMSPGGAVSIMPDAQSAGQPTWVPTDGVTQSVRGISLGTRAVRKDTGAFHGSQWRMSSMETSLQVAQ